jgi:hypothetical protein
VPSASDAAIALAERIFQVLDQGRFTATYKYAVLLAMLDLCLENVSRTGSAPDVLTTRQLGEKVLERRNSGELRQSRSTTLGLSGGRDSSSARKRAMSSASS